MFAKDQPRSRSAAPALILIALLVALGAAAGAAVGLLRPPGAQAAAVILVDPLDGNPFSTTTRGDNLLNLGTEAELVSSSQVIERVIAATGTTLSPEDLAAAVEVDVPTNTQLMTITVRVRNPDVALKLAQSFATEFLASRRDRASAQAETQTASLQSEVAERQRDRSALLTALSQASPTEVPGIQSQLDSANTQIISLQSRISQLRTGPFSPGMVVTPAALVPAPVWRNWPVLAVLGALGGAVLAGAVLLLRRPTHSAKFDQPIGSLAAEDLDPEAAPSDSVREVALTLLSDQHRPLKLMLATHGKDAPASADVLAKAIAATGHRTVVLDVAGVSRLPATGDLATRVFDGTAPATEAPLTVVAPGTIDEHEDLLLSPRMRSLLDSYSAQADAVLVVSGPRDGYAARALAGLVDGIVTEAPTGTAVPSIGDADRGVIVVAPRADGAHRGRAES